MDYSRNPLQNQRVCKIYLKFHIVENHYRNIFNFYTYTKLIIIFYQIYHQDITTRRFATRFNYFKLSV